MHSHINFLKKDLVEPSANLGTTFESSATPFILHTFILQLSPTSSLIRLNQDSLNQATSLKQKAQKLNI
jgi:hypothetical protein